MRKLTFILTLIAIFQISYGQIEIEDKSKPTKIKAVPYSGEFMSFDGVYNKEKKAGVVGHLVTLIDVSIYNIFQSEDDFESRNSLSHKYEDLFTNKTFEIIDYTYDLYDILKIKSDSATYIWKVGGTDKYVFNKYIENLKELYEGKTFIALHNESAFEALDGTKFNIEGDKNYKITSVKLAKLQFDYGIIFSINDSFDCVFPNGLFGQPTLFNGEKFITNKDYINIASNDIFKSKVILIEEKEFASFSTENKNYLEQIRNREVKLGMSVSQCRLAWGIPSSSLKNIAGYDEVLIYGEIGNSQNLYFKGGILKLIK